MKKILSWIFGSKGHGLPSNYQKLLDKDAVDIVGQLKHAGFETYLVGGCVRDILIGIKPKDFDIATRATPQQVRAVVKRSFIIGKRFRIVVAKRFSPAEKHSKEELFPVIISRAPEKEFQITIALQSGKSYLLLPAAGDWSNKYGGATDGTASGGGTLLFNGSVPGSNTPAPPASGNYLIDVNFITDTYTVTPQ